MGRYVVTFNLKKEPAEAISLLDGYEYERMDWCEEGRVDMEEGEFFSFLDEVNSRGLSLSVDGSSSWEKF